MNNQYAVPSKILNLLLSFFFKDKILTVFLFFAFSISTFAQETNKSLEEATKAVVNDVNNLDSTIIKQTDTIKKPFKNIKIAQKDSVKILVESPDNLIIKDTTNAEISPLDITDNRGIYIMADDGNLQFRILGSIRYSALFDNKLLSDKSRFSTFEIPTGDNDFQVLNYYNSLEFTRIGFEVTRRTSIGNIFIRLETDFAGSSGTYRIRHAYAQIEKFLVGKTWSLFSNVRAQGMSVNRNGPPGTISLRTAQMRYSLNIPYKNLKGDIALEYSLPEVNSNDSLSVNYINVQTVPNLSARITSKEKFGYLQVSGIAAPVSGIDSIGNKSSFMGFGLSVSGYWKKSENSRILFQGTYSRAVSHFINTFRNNQQDLIYNPDTEDFEAVSSWSGNLSYEYSWNDKLISNVSFGIADIVNKDYQPPEAFNYSYSLGINTFYTIVLGARVGVEYMYGKRFNKDLSTGNASRIWMLLYYDF